MLALCSDSCFESRNLSTCFSKAKLYIRHLPPMTFCLLFELALRVVGMLRLFQVVLSYRVVGKFITCFTLWLWDGYELKISWVLDVGDKHDLFMLQLHLIKQRHRWVIFACFPTAHLCPLGPQVRMNYYKLSALTTRGDAVGSPLTYYFFLS
jgi:hypothetical protein